MSTILRLIFLLCLNHTNAFARGQLVTFPAGQMNAPGTIFVHTSARVLYFSLGGGTAIRYPVAVGRIGKQWTGPAQIQSMREYPPWSPPDEVKRDNPRLPNVIPGGAPNNPMGSRALVLNRGQYAIHGTNKPGSIGTFASYGCVRMHNADIEDLYSRVSVGTQVIVSP